MIMRITQLGAVLLLLMVMGWSNAHAAEADAFALLWFTFDGGGQIAAAAGAGSGKYMLNSTFGQQDATVQYQSERFTLSAGFWSELIETPSGQANDKLFLPLIRVTK